MLLPPTTPFQNNVRSNDNQLTYMSVWIGWLYYVHCQVYVHNQDTCQYKKKCTHVCTHMLLNIQLKASSQYVARACIVLHCLRVDARHIAKATPLGQTWILPFTFLSIALLHLVTKISMKIEYFSRFACSTQRNASPCFVFWTRLKRELHLLLACTLVLGVRTDSAHGSVLYQYLLSKSKMLHSNLDMLYV